MNLSAANLEQPDQVLDFKLMDRIDAVVHIVIYAAAGNLKASNSARPARRLNASG